jgi:hypothetical protein
MVLLGIGLGIYAPSVTTAGVTAVEPARQSLAGGVVYMFQIAGGAVGLGLSTTVFSIASEHKLDAKVAEAGYTGSDSQLDAAQGILAGTDSARQALAQFPDKVANEISSFVNDAFVAGFQSVFRLDTALAFAGLVVSALFVGGALRLRRRTDPLEEPEAP